MTAAALIEAHPAASAGATEAGYRRHLDEVIAVAEKRKGVKQRAQRMRKWLPRGDSVSFKEEYEIEALAEFCTPLKTLLNPSG